MNKKFAIIIVSLLSLGIFAACNLNTTQWQAYKNDSHGFEFQRPQHWEIDAVRSNANAVVFTDKQRGAGESREAINFKLNEKNLSLEQVVNNLRKERGYTEQPINLNYPVKIGGVPTAMIETNEWGIQLYIFIHKGTIFMIETQKNLFTDDVLRTFKFI